MESTSSRLNDSGNATDVKSRSFQVDLDTVMADIVPLPTQDDDKVDYHSRSNGDACCDVNVCLESDESDYHSDCSLGSLNSLYLNLKYKRPDLNGTNGTTPLQNRNNDTSNTDRTPGTNVVARTRIATSRKYHNRAKYEKPTTKLNAFYFYGMQNAPCGYSRKSYVRQLKRKYPVASKTRKIKSSAAIYKYKRKVNKLRTSLKKRKRRKRIMNGHLVRHRFKLTIPLLKWRNGEQNGVRRLTNSVEKSRQNEIGFVTGRETVSNEQDHSSGPERTGVNNESCESDVLSSCDFADCTDGFEDTRAIDDIVRRLFDEDVD